MKKFNPRPQLWWIRNLKEAGSIPMEARIEEDMLARRADFLRQAAALEKDIVAHRTKTLDAVRREWSDDDVAFAKNPQEPSVD